MLGHSATISLKINVDRDQNFQTADKYWCISQLCVSVTCDSRLIQFSKQNTETAQKQNQTSTYIYSELNLVYENCEKNNANLCVPLHFKH